jgi:hypothetical protein
MEEIAAKTQDLKNPTDQLLVAYTLFGKQGASLVSSLRDGPDAMREMAEFAENVGMNLSQAQAEQVGASGDAYARLTMVATGAWRQIAAEAAPVLTVVYESITESVAQFSGFLKYLPDIIDNTVYFAGVMYDVYELGTLVQTTLHNIVTMNWSDVGKDIQSAFTFDTGAANVARIQSARDDAAAEADRKKKGLGDGESIIAQLEREKEIKQEALQLEKDRASEAKAAEQADARRRENEEEAIRSKFDAVRQEMAIQQQLASMSASEAAKREDEIRNRYALHAELSKQGMTDFSVIDRLTQQTESIRKNNEERNRLFEEADQIKRDQDPTIALRETLIDINKMVAQGMLTQQQAQQASLQAGEKVFKDNKDGKFGAVSAQEGSVEAYKLLLQRDNEQKEIRDEARQQTILQERMADLLEQANSKPTVQLARAR